MRILFTAHSYPPDVSGISEVVSQLSRRLALRGHEVHVATQLRAGTSSFEILDNVHIHRFAVKGNSVFGMAGAVREYVTFVTDTPWDTIVMHCAQIWTTDALLSHINALPAAKVFVFHGISALTDPAYQQYYGRLADGLRKMNAVVSLSELVEDTRFCNAFGLPPPTVIPNGADLECWAKERQGIRKRWQIGDRPWLVTVSNHNPLKGHMHFIQLARDVSRAIPQLAATIIGGSYPAAKYNLGRFGIKGGLSLIHISSIDIDRQAPTGVIGQDAARMAPNDSDQFLATQVKIIQSDSVLRPVVLRFKIPVTEITPLDGDLPTTRAQNAPITLKRLKVSRPPNTYLLLISYRSPNPELASAVTNAIAQSYIEHTYNIRFRAAAGLSAFMEKQMEELKAKMERSSAALAQFERDLSVINPEERTSILSSRLLQINTELTNAQADRVRKQATNNSVKGGSLEAAQASSQGEQLRKLADRLDEAREKFAVVGAVWLQPPGVY